MLNLYNARFCIKKSALIAGIFLLSCPFQGPVHALKLQSSRDPAAIYLQLADRIRREYVEPVNQEKLLEGSLLGMLESLDPHSTYYTAEKYEEIKNQTSGVYGGLGVEIMMEAKEGAIRVISPIDDGPGFKAGLQPGDLIVMINDDPVYGMTLYEASEKLRGQPNTPVKITIRRPLGLSKEITVTRELIKYHPIKSKTIGSIGYIRITTFNELTHKELRSAIQKIKADGKGKITGFILDVRNNAGGLFDQAIAVSNEFLKSGRIVSIKGRNSENDAVYDASGIDILENLPMVVLINSGSASAAEIFAGALQDNGRAIIAGTKSFGKGSVQTVFPLSFGGAIKLTTAYYLTPSGKSIQKTGIMPDIEINQLTDIKSLDDDHYRESKLKKALNPLQNSGDPSEPAASARPNHPSDLEKSPPKPLEPYDIGSDYQLDQAVNVLKAVQFKAKIPGLSS